MKFTNKTYDQLIEGDIIRANISNSKKKSKRTRKNICKEHTFIVLNSPQIKPKGRRHKLCVPACSFSSVIPTGHEKFCIRLEDFNVPAEIFGIKKENSILRISEPKCLKKFEYVGHLNDLSSYQDLWEEICEKINTLFEGKLQEYISICDCECFKDNEIEMGYCNQDFDYLTQLNEEALNKKIALVCSCCGSLINSEESKYIKCENCEDNVYVIWRNNETKETREIFEYENK